MGNNLKNSNKNVVLSVLKRVFGSPAKESDGQIEYEFNCPRPKCKHDHDKHNLVYNTDKNIFHCWKCKYAGDIYRILKDYGSNDEKTVISSVVPKSTFQSENNDDFKDVLSENITCKIPYGFKRLEWVNKTAAYTKAIEYLKKRGIDMDIIKKHNIGYVDTGYLKGRIIIPSYNVNEDMNYFVARSFIPNTKPSYIGPSSKKTPKDRIIFNEININFDLPIYLVEGAFDMFPIYNSVPMLGKFPSSELLAKLIKYKPRVILCLDEDAIMDSVEIYNMLSSNGIDAYFVEVPGDIGKYYEDNGHSAVMELLKKHRKIDLKFLLNLKMKAKKENQDSYDVGFMEDEWEKLQESFKSLD